MAKKQTSIPALKDSGYFLKLVLYLILGSLWIKITKNDTTQIPLPVGLVFGLIIATRERFKIDRKIEYAILLIAMFIGFWAPMGLYLNI